LIRRLLAVAVAFVILVAAAGAFLGFRPGSGAQDVVIPAGATTSQIGQILEREGVIASDSLFRVAVLLRRLEGHIRAGRYELRRRMGLMAALNSIARGPKEKGTGITVPEGFSLRQIARRVDARTHIGEQDFLDATQSGVVRSSLQPPGVETVEGFLFPETYFVSPRETASGLVHRMTAEFDRRTKSLDWAVPEAKGLSHYQTIVLASLVEREARVAEDRSKVAAVIYNRLAKGMRLQIDITALYGLDEHKVPTQADLRRPSPYNTYLIEGLPPTPIASPGLASIQAALHPADINALYYVVIDPSGKHGFTSSPEEFERLKRQRPSEVH
jgi:UPF0755 protein